MSADEKFGSLFNTIGAVFHYLYIYIGVLAVIFILLVVAVLLRIKKKQSGKADESGKKTDLSRLPVIVLSIFLIVMAIPIVYIIITG